MPVWFTQCWGEGYAARIPMETTSGPDPDPEQSVVRIETSSLTNSRHFAKGSWRARSAASQRLGVGDLLLWLTFVSIYFGIVRLKQPQADVGLLGLALLLAQATIAGTSWGGLWVVTLRSLRGVPLPRAPGHWFLVVLGVRLAVEALLGFKPGVVFASPNAVVSAATCCALVLPTLDGKLPALWKALFGVLVLLYALPLLGMCLSVWFGFAPANLSTVTSIAAWIRLILSPSLPLLASLYSAYRGASYRGLHWVGLTTWIAWNLLQPAMLDHFF